MRKISLDKAVQDSVDSTLRGYAAKTRYKTLIVLKFIECKFIR
jgi:hypothetical protein